MGQTLDLLFSALGNNSVERMLPILSRGATLLALTDPPSPRASDPRGWPGLAEGEALPLVVDHFAGALREAFAGQEDWPLVICGAS